MEEIEINTKTTRNKIASMMEDLDVVDYCDSFQDSDCSSVTINFKDGKRMKIDVSAIEDFDSTRVYVCEAKSKCSRYFRCTFTGKGLNEGTEEKPKDCPLEKISLCYLGTLTKGAQNFIEDYPYVVCRTYGVAEEAYLFKSLSKAKLYLKLLKNPDYILWEKREKPNGGGAAFVKKYIYDDEAIVEAPPETGLHIKWLLERKTLVRKEFDGLQR